MQFVAASGLTSRQMRVSSGVYSMSGGPSCSRRCLRHRANSSLRRRDVARVARPGWPGFQFQFASRPAAHHRLGVDGAMPYSTSVSASFMTALSSGEEGGVQLFYRMTTLGVDRTDTE